MYLTKWQSFFFALAVLIFIGQSAVARAAICPMQAQSIAQTDTPPCHHHTETAVKPLPHEHPTPPDCCQQLGHCLVQAAALIETELSVLAAASRAGAFYGYLRTAPLPQNEPVFRPPINA